MTPLETTPKFIREVLIGEGEIRSRLEQLAIEIAKKYQGKRLLLVGVLNGAFMVMADLSRELHRAGLTDIEIDFVQISSYGQNNESSRNPHLLKDTSVDISGRHIIIVEDIVDTGYSLAALLAIFAARGATSIETFALLSKPDRREIEVDVQYIGFKVGNWVEGMGLDTNQSGRANPDIVKVTEI